MTLAFTSIADFIAMNGYKNADRLWLGVLLTVAVIMLMIAIIVIQQKNTRVKVFKRWRSLEENKLSHKDEVGL